MDQCEICFNFVTQGTGRTQLSCGHVYHPHCIHNYLRGANVCPKCPKLNGNPLDFGNNPAISKAVRETLFVSNPGSAPEQKSSWSFPWAAPKTYPTSATPDELVNLGAPVEIFQERKITIKDLINSGVKLEGWLTKRSLEDLKKMGITWDDMIYMGFTPDKLKLVPISFIVDVLKSGIQDLVAMGTSWQHLVQAKYTAKDLLSLGCTTHVLISMGMNAEQMQYFGFTQTEWDTLALQNF